MLVRRASHGSAPPLNCGVRRLRMRTRSLWGLGLVLIVVVGRPAAREYYWRVHPDVAFPSVRASGLPFPNTGDVVRDAALARVGVITLAH
jgi:hypothetical protein